MLNLVLFGPPGAGKGTQSEKLIEKYELVHFSTGDILRSEIANKTPLGIEAKKSMDKGQLVSDEIVIGMIDKKIEENVSSKGFIFDGFPRTTEQAVALDKVMQKRNIKVSAMLALEVKKEELVKRLLNRGKTSGRADDLDISIIENRVKVYNEKTAPVIDFYKEQNKFSSIQGTGTIDEIFGRLSDAIDGIA